MSNNSGNTGQATFPRVVIPRRSRRQSKAQAARERINSASYMLHKESSDDVIMAHCMDVAEHLIQMQTMPNNAQVIVKVEQYVRTQVFLRGNAESSPKFVRTYELILKNVLRRELRKRNTFETYLKAHTSDLKDTPIVCDLLAVYKRNACLSDDNFTKIVEHFRSIAADEAGSDSDAGSVFSVDADDWGDPGSHSHAESGEAKALDLTKPWVDPPWFVELQALNEDLHTDSAMFCQHVASARRYSEQFPRLRSHMQKMLGACKVIEHVQQGLSLVFVTVEEEMQKSELESLGKEYYKQVNTCCASIYNKSVQQYQSGELSNRIQEWGTIAGRLNACARSLHKHEQAYLSRRTLAVELLIRYRLNHERSSLLRLLNAIVKINKGPDELVTKVVNYVQPRLSQAEARQSAAPTADSARGW